MLARLARVLFVGALLASWQAGLQHPVEHVDELGDFVHLAGGHSDEGGEPLCDLLAALAACAAQSPLFLGTMASQYDAPALALGTPRAADAPPFLAQGPPARA